MLHIYLTAVKQFVKCGVFCVFKKKQEEKRMKLNLKNMAVMFVFVIACILVAKAIGERVPAVGKITEKI